MGHRVCRIAVGLSIAVMFSANVSKMARDKSFFYGILAILIAISASLVVNFATSLASDKE